MRWLSQWLLCAFGVCEDAISEAMLHIMSRCYLPHDSGWLREKGATRHSPVKRLIVIRQKHCHLSCPLAAFPQCTKPFFLFDHLLVHHSGEMFSPVHEMSVCRKDQTQWLRRMHTAVWIQCLTCTLWTLLRRHLRGIARLTSNKAVTQLILCTQCTNKLFALQTSGTLEPRMIEKTQIGDVRFNHCVNEYVHCYLNWGEKKKEKTKRTKQQYI